MQTHLLVLYANIQAGAQKKRICQKLTCTGEGGRLMAKGQWR